MAERKRNLSDSSGDEAELKKLARIDSDRDSLTEVTDRTDSDSSSDSDSDTSDSNSSSSSSSSEDESQTQENCSETQDMNLSTQSNSEKSTTQSHESGNDNSQAVMSAQIGDTDERCDKPMKVSVDLDKDLDLTPQEGQLVNGESICLDNADSGEFSLDALGSLDEIQQFLTNSATASGPVDPVFVDHEDSQNATHMDSLVFDPTIQNIPGITDIKAATIPGIDDLNEPMLESVCNSTVHSTDGSVLGNEFEEGELPSSPEAEQNITQHQTNEDPESFCGNNFDIGTISNHSRPANVIETDDDSDDEKVIKRKKKTKKRKKDAKDSETDKDEVFIADVPRRHSKHKKSKQPLPCHDKETNHSKSSSTLLFKSTYHKLSNKDHSNSKMSKLSSVATSVLDEKCTNKTSSISPRKEQNKISKSSIDKKYEKQPPLPEIPVLVIEKNSVKSNPPPPPFPPEPSHVVQKCTGSPEDSEDKVLNPHSPLSHPNSPKYEKKKSKKLSLKDYKAKKEAEKQRKSMEGSGSESNSTTVSEAPSKETSPVPESNILEDKESSKLAVVDESSHSEKDGKNMNALDMEPISDNDMDTGHPEENDALRGFDVLDEIDDIESENDISKESGDDSDSLAEDEVDQMLEEDVPKPSNDDKEDIEPQEKLKKLVLEERGQNVFEVLPLGWVSVTHNSGIPLYLHRDTRVVSTSRPYDLGNGSVRKHNIPISAIPCYSYKYYSEGNDNSSASNPCSSSEKSNSNADNYAESSSENAKSKCPYGAPNMFTRENVSPDSTTDGAISANTFEDNKLKITDSSEDNPNQPVSVPTVDTNIFPKAQIETIEETLKKTELSPEEVTKYCEKIFVFKELEVAKFKTWKERRAYYKQSQKKKLEKELTNRPTLPEGTKIITIPSLELSTIPGTEGDSAINQKVVKKTKKKWIINPVGKSMVRKNFFHVSLLGI